MRILFMILLTLCIQGRINNTYAQSHWDQYFIKVSSNAPNILWITTDQQRWDTIHALGNKYIHTPNLNRLVKEGVSFTHDFVQTPICTPSRASFMTGMYPETIHATKNGAAKWPETAPLISKILHDNGYDTGLAGKLHLSTAMAHKPEKFPKHHGYRVVWFSHSPLQGASSNDYLKWYKKRRIDIIELHKEYGYVPEKYHQTTWLTDRTIDFIELHKNAEQPWFFSLNIFDPHPPFDPPQEFIDQYDIDKLPKPWVSDSDIKRKSQLNGVMLQSRPHLYAPHENKLREAKYWAQIDLIDKNLGRILNTLQGTGQLHNTLIIFSSDHGTALGDHGLVAKGCRFYEGLVRVPLIFWYPKKIKKNLQSSALVESIDIVPTLLDLIGLKIPERI